MPDTGPPYSFLFFSFLFPFHCHHTDEEYVVSRNPKKYNFYTIYKKKSYSFLFCQIFLFYKYFWKGLSKKTNPNYSMVLLLAHAQALIRNLYSMNVDNEMGHTIIQCPKHSWSLIDAFRYYATTKSIRAFCQLIIKRTKIVIYKREILF